MLSIDYTVIFVFLLVWGLVVVLSRIFFKPVNRMMDKREARIREDKEAGGRALEAYERDLKRIEEDLKAARAESEKIREALETEALREKARLLAELQAESRQEVKKAKEEIDEHIGRLRTVLAGEAERLAENIEKRILH